MVELQGWVRLELNSLLRFTNVQERSFGSILRRSLVWQVFARFYDADYVRKHVPRGSEVGIFPRDPTLKEFLQSGPAIASMLRLQHDFERSHNREQCHALI